MSYSKPFQTVEEGLEYFNTLSDDEEPIDICQLPPEESGCLTGEKYIDEDTFQSVLPADVCSKIKISTNIDNDEISHEDMFDPEEPSTKKGMSNSKRKFKSNETNLELRWRRKVNLNKILKISSTENMCEKFPRLVTLSPIEIFHKFIPTEYLLHLANMERIYAMLKGEYFSVDENDTGQFFGLLLFSGYHQVPGEDSYWNTQEDLSVPMREWEVSIYWTDVFKHIGLCLKTKKKFIVIYLAMR
ncbi:DDE_Tnp_1_7 domain-containing protein [Trichonephila clavipes]|nr:DDE_Tnp_1_7 domain-containing protein [Trichonephila clavipes]